MKKLFSVGLVLSLLLALLTGCQSPGPEQDLGNKFIFGEDNQYYFYLSGIFGHPIAESESGYYTFLNGYIYTLDKETGKCIPLCNKPDCMHDDREFHSDGSSTCNAYFGAIQQMSYYKGNLYVLSADTIYEMDASGSTRKQLLQAKEHIFTSMVHRGYLYLSFSDYLLSPEEYTQEELKNSSYRVERYRLDHWDGKSSVVYERRGVFGTINSMFAFGNKIYMPSTANDYTTAIFDIVTKEITENNEIPGCAIAPNNRIVYFKIPEEWRDDLTIEEIYKIRCNNMAVIEDAEGNTQKTEISQVYSYLYSSSQLIAADNRVEVTFENLAEEDRGIGFYDANGKLIREIKTENDTMPSLGMNEDYFFYMKQSENGENDEVWAIDLHKLDDPNLKGEPFFVSEE